ncbi:Proteinase inhibitor [Morus notabilis]|uniref:Proteinase inhibitor n=1 Tax=Morus notabilis TaxID=981085 RepID=W9RBQ1_9ROSA|nr:Proteinase inhibitor [Morus notabilis]
MASERCQGKKSWPELVGVSGEIATATIERENPTVHAIIKRQGTGVTDDLKCNRVWVWVDAHGVVTTVPMIG